MSLYKFTHTFTNIINFSKTGGFMSVTIIHINDSWPTMLIWRSQREKYYDEDRNKLLCVKSRNNANIVDSFQELLELVTNKSFSIIAIQIDNILSNKADRIEILATSIRTTCSCTNKILPDICVYAQAFDDKNVIQHLIDSSINIIDLNLHKSSSQDWSNVRNSLKNNKRYIDPTTIFYMQSKSTSLSRKGSKLTQMIERGTIGYYLCPRIKATDEVADNLKLLKKELNLEAYLLNSFIELFPILGDPFTQVDIIWVDAEEIAAHDNASPYQLVNTIVTMIEITDRKYRTKLCIAVDSSTPVKLMRELQKIKGVHGLFGRTPEFTYNEIKNQIKLILSNRDPTPVSIKNLLNGKQPKDKNGIHLTDREIQIRDLICNRGSSNKVIANSLGVSEATVKVHLGTVFKKYGVKNRAELLIKLKNAT